MSPKQVTHWAHQLLSSAAHPWEKNLAHFLLEWYDPKNPTITIHTSGSTGAPQAMQVTRQAMIESALRTCHFFGLKEGMNALLCLDTRFIAGKMMIVRAIVCGLNLIVVPPTLDPLASVAFAPDFAALVPAQVMASLQNPDSRHVLNQTRILLIGGAPLPPHAEEQLSQIHPSAWITYGMTETLTHVAVRRAGEQPPAFNPLPGVKFRIDTDGCLRIQAPFLDNEIKTNDVAEILPDGRFLLLGRADFVINSGGIKLYPEQLEQRLASFFTGPFFITSRPHPLLGEVPVIVAEASLITPGDIKELKQTLIPLFSSRERPVALIPVSKIYKSESGKILRQQTLTAPENENSPMIELES
ncbi:MAG: AMP-binding protein [Bacteroidales bacterium]